MAPVDDLWFVHTSCDHESSVAHDSSAVWNSGMRA